MIKLSEEQSNAVNHIGNVYVTACPGSGKTRALTARLALSMKKLSNYSTKVLAVTYTNRAANEIKERIEQDEEYDRKKIWSGTIHSFCLEWVLKPYAGYFDELNSGYALADEYETRKIIAKLKKDKGMGYFDDVNTSFDRDGNVYNSDSNAREVEVAYREILNQRKKIDFDQTLYFAYLILDLKPEIATTLGAIFRLICIDEVQDTQVLQYAILSKIYNASLVKPSLFIVGDINQAIYQSLGGVSKTLDELNHEFVGSNLVGFSFSDNYRSTQRIADYFTYFRNTQEIKSKAKHADESGNIFFSNQGIDKHDLAATIANIIESEIKRGVAENEICIIAPQWSPIRTMSKQLVNLLPDVRFDAPSLSPFYGQQDNIWLTVAKLSLTIPSGRLYSTRIRWANEVINYLDGSHHPLMELTAKKLLAIINSFRTYVTVGTDYLAECFLYLLSEVQIDMDYHTELAEAYSMFFEKANKNMESCKEEYEDHIDVFRGFFKESVGVVINSCHGIKGEEYETVIAFGMLEGYVPNWNDMYCKSDEVTNDAESKMLYVISSRAKKNLYLISENGRKTKKGNPYNTSPLLNTYKYAYDDLY